MKAYLGISHLNYPNDQEGFHRALSKRIWWPIAGFFIPFISLFITRGMDLNWPKGMPPPNWFGWMIAISGFGYPALASWSKSSISKLRNRLKAPEDANLSDLIPKLYASKSNSIWKLYYKTLYLYGVFIFLTGMAVGCGLSIIVFFAIGRS
jgi:hypothetical protein